MITILDRRDPACHAETSPEAPMTARPKIYLAGPEVFLEDAEEIGRRKKALCGEYGFEGLFPLDEDAPRPAGERIDRAIYRALVAMMAHADCGIFDLTPFRGSSADVGTVFELGMLAGLGKPVFGYSNLRADYRSRLEAAGLAARDGKKWRDPLGMLVEDFGNADNLMIDACLAEGGFPMVRMDVAEEDRFRDLRGFEACLELASRALLGEPALKARRS
jgi:nucleoside 2-deoxyribosyltransferase